MSIEVERGQIKGSELFYIDQRHSSESDKLNGALDVLLDCSNALHEFNINRATGNVPKLLDCYGFLQVLYIQQDAVRELSLLVGLTTRSGRGFTGWGPRNNRLKCRLVRDVRNNVVGHPSNNNANSTAIIPPRLINTDQFEYALYGIGTIGLSDFQRGIVNFDDFIARNEHSLVAHLKRIKKEIWKLENNYRVQQNSSPLGQVMHQGWSYEWNSVYLGYVNFKDNLKRQYALSCANSVKSKFQSLETEISNRNLWKPFSRYDFDQLIFGLDSLINILGQSIKSKKKWQTYDLIYHGTNKHIEMVLTYVQSFDDEMKKKIK